MNSYVLLIALVVATGGFVFGVDSGKYLPTVSFDKPEVCR